jgi:hypothetical protein
MCGVFIPVQELYDVTGTGCVRFKIAQVTASGTFCFIAASSSEAGRVYLHRGVCEIVGACVPNRLVQTLLMSN